MGEVIKFPTIQTSSPQETVSEKSVQAFLFEGFPNITIGGEIVVEVCGKKYSGIVTDILQRDKNNNITKIAYNIPFLNSNDPFKFGEAKFTYKIETYE